MIKEVSTNPCTNPECTPISGFEIVNPRNTKFLGITCSNGCIHPPHYKDGASTGKINRDYALNDDRTEFLPIVGERNHLPKYPAEEDFFDPHGEVPTHLVEHLKILDVVEISINGHPPEMNYQSENVFFLENSFNFVQ